MQNDVYPFGVLSNNKIKHSLLIFKEPTISNERFPFLPGGRVTSIIVRIINIYARYMCGTSSVLLALSDGLRRFYAGGKEGRNYTLSRISVCSSRCSSSRRFEIFLYVMI